MICSLRVLDSNYYLSCSSNQFVQPMQEDFLYYVWRLQYFDKKALRTTQGESLQILQPGLHNEHAGPDFLNSQIIRDDITWHGHIELHCKSSDWYAHQHQTDPAYGNVVLHVVWDHNQEVEQQDGTTIPTLVLKDRVAPRLYQQYQRLVHATTPILCAKQLPQVKSIDKTTMLDKALFQRLTHKNNLVYQLLKDNQGNWEETAYQLLAYNFGFKVNSSTFLDLALQIPLKVLTKHAADVLQIEALLLGQSGLLPSQDKTQDPYLAALHRAHAHLAHKYKLPTGRITASQWKFFRLRPANFPTMRIAQFAQLLHQNPSLFELLVNTPTKMLYKRLAVTPSDYWQRHYHFGQPSKKTLGSLGKASVEGLLINTAVPLLVAYGKAKDEQDYVDRAVAILQHLPAEHNKITRYWEEVGIHVQSAFDSQALIELFNNFCSKKQCLSCNIGASIMQSGLAAS